MVGQVISKDRIEIQRNDQGFTVLYIIAPGSSRFSSSHDTFRDLHVHVRVSKVSTTRYPFVSRNPVIQSVGSESVFPLRISTAA